MLVYESNRKLLFIEQCFRLAKWKAFCGWMVVKAAWRSNRIKLKPIILAYILYMTRFLSFLLLSPLLRMTYISNTSLTLSIQASWSFHTKVAPPPSHMLSIPFARCSLSMDLPCLASCYHLKYIYINYLKVCWLVLYLLIVCHIVLCPYPR